MENKVFILFDDVDEPVAFIGCEDVIETVPAIFSRWSFQRVVPENPNGPFIKCERVEKGYRLSSPFMEKSSTLPDPLNVLCSLVVELCWASLRANPGRLCVHGAAVDFSGRLVLFPSARRAGKSTLTACLAAAGKPVFTDDFLSIEINENGQPLGLASGVAPRIRNPVPADISTNMSDYLERTVNITNRQYSYLQVGNKILAPRGASLPIGAIVLLQREDGISPSINPADKAEILKTVIVQNFSRAQNAGRILQVLHYLASTVELRVLRYSRAEDAVALLNKEFVTWPKDVQTNGLPSANDALLAEADLTDRPLQPALVADISYAQSESLVEYNVENALFLADSDGYAIHQLNEMSSAVWSVLAQPATFPEISDLFCDAFPDQPRKSIENDIRVLLEQFVQNGLVTPTQAQGC